jgi:hypothetical protein
MRLNPSILFLALLLLGSSACREDRCKGLQAMADVTVILDDTLSGCPGKIILIDVTFVAGSKTISGRINVPSGSFTAEKNFGAFVINIGGEDSFDAIVKLSAKPGKDAFGKDLPEIGKGEKDFAGDGNACNFWEMSLNATGTGCK